MSTGSRRLDVGRGVRVSSRSLVALAIVLGLTTTGCPKKHKPPPMARVWLGAEHGCALESAGRVVCWGENGDGQLADGTRETRAVAAAVAFDGAPTELLLAPGETCGIFEGRVRCWGRGAGEGADVGVVGATALAATARERCALTDGGGVRCWSSSGAVSSLPWLEGRTSTLLAGGGFFCAALASPRAVRCDEPEGLVPGVASQQQVIPPSDAVAAAPDAAALDAVARGVQQGASHGGVRERLVGFDVVGLAVGARHACAVEANGDVRCWGEGDKGQLGAAVMRGSSEPVRVDGAPPSSAVGAGRAHSCALARSGVVWCWGDNTRYQLADGTTEPRAVPRPVPGLIGVKELAVAGDAACARLKDASVRCWGGNERGQLALGTHGDGSVPMPLRFRPSR